MVDRAVPSCLLSLPAYLTNFQGFLPVASISTVHSTAPFRLSVSFLIINNWTAFVSRVKTDAAADVASIWHTRSRIRGTRFHLHERHCANYLSFPLSPKPNIECQARQRLFDKRCQLRSIVHAHEFALRIEYHQTLLQDRVRQLVKVGNSNF